MVPNRAEKNNLCIEERPERRRDISFCKFPMTSLQFQPISGHPTDPRYCATVLSGYANTLRQRSVTAGSCSYMSRPPNRETVYVPPQRVHAEDYATLLHILYTTCLSRPHLCRLRQWSGASEFIHILFLKRMLYFSGKQRKMLSKKHGKVTCIGKRQVRKSWCNGYEILSARLQKGPR